MELKLYVASTSVGGRAVPRSKNDGFSKQDDYFGAMVGFTQPFFITPCDGRKLR
jgi:hypothetical protein